MAYAFPTVRHSSDLREMCDTPDVRAGLANPSSVPTLNERRSYAKRFLKTTTNGANGLVMLTLLADDTLALICFGKRGGQKRVWTFGRRDR